MKVRKQQLELDMEQCTGSKLGKEYFKAVYGHPTCFIICRVQHQNAELDESQAGIKIVVRSINNLGHIDDTTLMSESQEELKSLLMKVKKESKKAGFKFNIQKTKIMASYPITSLHIDGETMETVTDSIFLGSKITADGDCSHEIKRCLLLGKKARTNLDSILKSRDITLPKKGPSSQGYSFSSSQVWM